MKSVPDIITVNSGKGTAFAYLMDIIPGSGDTWGTKRYATHQCTVDGDDYEAGTIASITVLTQAADLTMAGAADTADAVTIRFSPLHTVSGSSVERSMDTFARDFILGRELKIYLSAISHNKVENGSFEYFDGSNNPDEWGRVEDGTYAFVYVSPTAGAYHGSHYCVMQYLAGGSTPPKITTKSFTLNRGSHFRLTWAQRSVSGTFGIKVAVNIGGLWANMTTGALQLLKSTKTYTNAAANIWEEFEWEAGWHTFITGTGAILNDDHTISVNCYVEFEIVNQPSQVLMDAVQVNPLYCPMEFTPDRYHLESDDIMLRFYGRIRDAEWDGHEYVIKAESLQSEYHREIPIGRISEQLYPSKIITKESIGKPIPMTYGGPYSTNEFAAAAWPSAFDDTTGECIMGRLVHLDPPTICFDREDLAMYALDRVVAFNDDSKYYYYEKNTDPSPGPSGTPEWIKAAATSKAYEDVTNAVYLKQNRIVLWGTVRPEVVLGSSGAWTNPNYAVNGAMDGLWYNAAQFTGSPGSNGYLDIIMKAHNMGDAHLLGIWFLGAVDHVWGTGASASTKADVTIRSQQDAFTSAAITLASGNAYTFDNCPWGRIGAAGVPSQNWVAAAFPISTSPYRINSFLRLVNEMKMRIQLYHDSGITPDGTYGTVSVIHECGILVEFTLDLLKAKLGGEGSGREFQDTWGSRRTAGTLITNPCDTIESILRDELAVPSAGINTTAFDSARSAVTLAVPNAAQGQIIEFEDSEEVINRICEQFRLLYFYDIEGLISLKVLQHGTPVKTFRARDFIHDSIKATWTNYQESINDIEVNYRKNPFTGEFTAQAFCNKDAQNIGAASYQTKCQASYSAVKTVNKATIDADFIYDETQAEALVKWFIDWTGLPRLIISGDLFMKDCGLEIGDLVDLDRVQFERWIPATVPADSVFIVTETKISLSEKRVAVKMMEVKAP